MNREELFKFVSDAEATISHYHWEDRVVHPYPGCAINVMKILADCKDYDICTTDTRIYLRDLAAGFKRILDAWVRYEKAPKVMVRVRETGKVMQILESDMNLVGELVDRI